MKKNTYTRAYEASEAFFADTGQMPTIEAIKPIIGINSPSIISSAIKDWKSALSQTIKKDQGLSPSVPKKLQDAVAGLWEQALSEAKIAIMCQPDEVQAKQIALEAKETALADETRRIRQLVNVTEQKFQGEINYLEKESSRLTAESLALAEQNRNYHAIAIEFEKKNAVLIEEIRHEKAKFTRLEIQYDKEHDWALKRIAEEKENYRQQIHNEMNRLQSEANRRKQAAELLQAKCDLLGSQANTDQSKLIELERNLSDEKLKLAGLALTEAKLQKEINAKDERIRTLLNKAHKKTP